MTISKNIPLAVLLALQVALIAFLYRPDRHQAPPAAAILQDLTPASLTALTISDSQGKSLSLVKKEDWRLAEGDYPADAAKIDTLLKKLVDMKASRLVSQTPATFARLKVAEGDFNRKVTLEQGGKSTVLYLGTAPNSKSIHLRLAEGKEVYQINDLAAWEVLPEKASWWQGNYIRLERDALTSLSIVNPQGKIDLRRDEKKDWRLAAKPDIAVDGKRVQALLGALGEVTVASYLSKDAVPQGAPQVTITYQGKEGGPVTVQVWAKDKAEDQEQVVKSTASDFPAKVKAYGLKGALELTEEALLAKPDNGIGAVEPDGGAPATKR